MSLFSEKGFPCPTPSKILIFLPTSAPAKLRLQELLTCIYRYVPKEINTFKEVQRRGIKAQVPIQPATRSLLSLKGAHLGGAWGNASITSISCCAPYWANQRQKRTSYLPRHLYNSLLWGKIRFTQHTKIFYLPLFLQNPQSFSRPSIQLLSLWTRLVLHLGGAWPATKLPRSRMSECLQSTSPRQDYLRTTSTQV